jgi:Pectate lyase superfamily protein
MAMSGVHEIRPIGPLVCPGGLKITTGNKKMKTQFGILPFCAVLLCHLSTPLFASNIQVSDYGAVPGDGKNDTSAIQAAINAAIKTPGSTVLFAPGTYDIAAPDGAKSALSIVGASHLTLMGGGATLRIGPASSGIVVQDSTDVLLQNLSVDWATLPFVEARVASFVNTDPVVTIVGGTAPSTSGTPVTSLYLYDEVNARPAAGDNDWYASGTLTALGGGKARLTGFPSNVPRVGVGASLVIRYQTYGADAIVGINDLRLTFTQVSVHSAPGMAVYLSGCEDVVFSNFRVGPPSGATQWISTNADGIHATLCRGGFSVSDSTFAALGDDAFNIGGLMLLAQPGPAAKQVLLRHGKPQGSGVSPPRVGDVLVFSQLDEPYKALFSATVVAAAPASGLPVQLTVTLDKDVPASLQSNAVVYNSSAQPVVHLTRISIKNNRARGFWLQALSGSLNDCLVSGSSGPAVELRSDITTWWEGPAPTSVSVVNCRFENCNYGPGESGALINSYAIDSTGGSTTVRALDSITFTHCDFIASGPLLSFKSARSVTISNCKYSSPSAIPVAADATTSLVESSNNVAGSGAPPVIPIISIKAGS